MDIRPIRTHADHEAALREIERLWGAPAGSPEGDKLDVLATLVDVYESAQWPVDASDPVDLLRYLIEDAGHTQQELAEIIGSKSRASEILGRRRALTIDMIDRISNAWKVPRGLLAVPYDIVRPAKAAKTVKAKKKGRILRGRRRRDPKRAA